MVYIYHLNNNLKRVEVDSFYRNEGDSLEDWYQYLIDHCNKDPKDIFVTDKSLLYVGSTGIFCLALES